MKALVTGASSGMGYDMSKYLSKLGYDIIAVARDVKGLERLKNECSTNVDIISMDLSDLENCNKLYESLKNEDVDIVVNDAGFEIQGEFSKINLNKELSLINLNIVAVHILTKLFLIKMKEKNKGYILNVASMGAYTPGPLMSAYYASKAYVLSLTLGINKELEKSKSNVHISALCPGPVKTNFDNVANVHFKNKYLNSEFVAKYAINKLLKNKTVIIPGMYNKISRFLLRFLSDKTVAKLTYHINNNKNK